MIESASSARGPVNYDVIAALRKKEEFIKKLLEEITGVKCLLRLPS